MKKMIFDGAAAGEGGHMLVPTEHYTLAMEGNKKVNLSRVQ